MKTKLEDGEITNERVFDSVHHNFDQNATMEGVSRECYCSEAHVVSNIFKQNQNILESETKKTLRFNKEFWEFYFERMNWQIESLNENPHFYKIYCTTFLDPKTIIIL